MPLNIVREGPETIQAAETIAQPAFGLNGHDLLFFLLDMFVDFRNVGIG